MILILVIGALIAYGTLYPLSFQPNPHASLRTLARSVPHLLTPRFAVDTAANILLYVPLGLALFLRASHTVGRLAGALFTLLFCFAFSLTLEYLQFFQPGRVPAGADVLTNTLGGGLGILAASLWWRYGGKLRLPVGASLVLWATWIVALLFPLIPVIGLFSLRAKLRGAISFDVTVFIGAVAQWLTACVLLARRRPSVAGATLLLVPAQLLIAGRQPTLALMIGAAFGAALACVKLSPRTTATIAVLLVILWGLSPFRPGPETPFTWIPFADALENARIGGVATILAKCFVYGGAALLLIRARVSATTATVLIAGLLTATEVAQMRIAGRTAALTDPVIAIIAGALLGRFRVR